MQPNSILTQFLYFIIILTLFSCEKDNSNSEDLITVETGGVSEITSTTAVISAELSQLGKGVFGFYYSSDPEFINDINRITITSDLLNGLNYELNITNLNPNQEYFYKSFYNTTFGSVKSFTTYDYPNISITNINIVDKTTINIQAQTNIEYESSNYKLGFNLLDSSKSLQESKLLNATNDSFGISFENLNYNNKYLIVPIIQIDDLINSQDTIEISTLSNFNIEYVDSINITGVEYRSKSPCLIPQTSNYTLAESFYLDEVPGFIKLSSILTVERTENPQYALFAGHNNSDAKIVNMDILGSTVNWEYTLGGSESEWIEDIQVVSDGYLFLGFTYSSDGPFEIREYPQYSDMFLLKLDKQGNKLWLKTYGTTRYDYPTRITPSSDGNYYLLGSTEFKKDGSSDNLASDSYMIKINEQGEIISESSYNLEYGSSIYSLCESSLNDKIIGSSCYNSSDVNQHDAVLSRLSGDNVVWSTYFKGNGYDYIYNIFQLNNENLVIVGNTSSNSGDFSLNNTGYTVWLSIVDLNNGEVIETYILNPNSNGYYREAIFVDDKIQIVYDNYTNEKAYKIEVTF